MARPSRNIDQLLLDAGLELLPATGCRALSARMLTEHAGVNLGMFHYHFRSKDNFIRTLLTQVYEQMFAKLVITAAETQSPIQNLRNALHVLAQFGRRHHRLLMRIITDAIAGEAVAAEFLRTNVPRHVGLLSSLIVDAQAAGHIVKIPLPQAIAFIGGSILAPVLLGSALVEHGMLSATTGSSIKKNVLSKLAVEQRIDFALRGLAVPTEAAQ